MKQTMIVFVSLFLLAASAFAYVDLSEGWVGGPKPGDTSTGSMHVWAEKSQSDPGTFIVHARAKAINWTIGSMVLGIRYLTVDGRVIEKLVEVPAEQQTDPIVYISTVKLADSNGPIKLVMKIKVMPVNAHYNTTFGGDYNDDRH